MDNRQIVIFDGVCNFCNAAVNFIIARDPAGMFVFTPRQSDLAQALMAEYGINDVDTDTLLLIKSGQCFVFSSAALEIAGDLAGCWSWFKIFKWLPVPLRDFFYKLFARYRYRLFGKQSECVLPAPEVRSRFIGL